MMSPSLTIRIAPDSHTSSAMRVALGGRLDSATAPELERALQPLLRGDATSVVLELAELNFLSSAGIRILVAAQKALRARRGTLVLSRPQRQVATALGIVMALPDLTLFEDDGELDRYLAELQTKALDARRQKGGT